jgi:hypothetical protein
MNLPFASEALTGTKYSPNSDLLYVWCPNNMFSLQLLRKSLIG